MKIDIEEINNLFEQLHEITKIDNIAMHEFINGELNPIHMFDNGKVPIEKWKKVHRSIHVKIKEDKYLSKIADGEIVYIEDSDKLEYCPDEFKTFNIKTNFVIPLHKGEEVIGMVLTPSIGKVVKLDKKTREKCIELINEYSKTI